jgi:hypothetical protein
MYGEQDTMSSKVDTTSEISAIVVASELETKGALRRDSDAVQRKAAVRSRVMGQPCSVSRSLASKSKYRRRLMVGSTETPPSMLQGIVFFEADGIVYRMMIAAMITADLPLRTGHQQPVWTPDTLVILKLNRSQRMSVPPRTYVKS